MVKNGLQTSENDLLFLFCGAKVLLFYDMSNFFKKKEYKAAVFEPFKTQYSTNGQRKTPKNSEMC